MTTIAFIGLGNMGAPMAVNLVAACAAHDAALAGGIVRGFDPVAPVPPGIIPAASVADAATGADVVITMLPDGAVLRAVAADIVAAASPGALYIDCSTVDVDSARAVASLSVGAGLEPVDAPVSGGTGGAQAGTLTFMIGGTDAGCARAAPFLGVMGARVVHCGGAGTGQAAKICNNMILGATMLATSEAFVLADALGLDRAALYDVAQASSGQSWSLTTYCPAPGVGPVSPADHGYVPGFAGELMLKDLRLSQQAAAGADAATPMGALAATLYEAFAGDMPGKDFSAVLPWLTRRTRNGNGEPD